MKTDNRRTREWIMITNPNGKTMEKTSIYPVHRKLYIAWPGQQHKPAALPTPEEKAEKKGFIAYPKKCKEHVSSTTEASNAIITCKEGLFIAYPKRHASELISEAIAEELTAKNIRPGYVAYPPKGRFIAMVKYKAFTAIFKKKVAVLNLCQLFRLKAS